MSNRPNRYDPTSDLHHYVFDEAGSQIQIHNEVVHMLSGMEDRREAVLLAFEIMFKETGKLTRMVTERAVAAAINKVNAKTAPMPLPTGACGVCRRPPLTEPVPQWTHTIEDLAFNLFKLDPRVIEFVERVAEAKRPLGRFTRFSDGHAAWAEYNARVGPVFEKAWQRGAGGQREVMGSKPESEWVSDAYEKARGLDHALAQQRKERKVR